MMFDEVENFDWSNDFKMRAVIDAAYECDGSIDRVDRGGNPFNFHVFSPALWAWSLGMTDVTETPVLPEAAAVERYRPSAALLAMAAKAPPSMTALRRKMEIRHGQRQTAELLWRAGCCSVLQIFEQRPRLGDLRHLGRCRKAFERGPEHGMGI
jgi:hypothetical protein